VSQKSMERDSASTKVASCSLLIATRVQRERGPSSRSKSQCLDSIFMKKISRDIRYSENKLGLDRVE